MKSNISPVKASDRFASILSYSRRFRGNRPTFTAEGLRAYRSASRTVRDSSVDPPLSTQRLAVPQSPPAAFSRPRPKPPNLIIKPMEVLLDNYRPCDQYCDELFAKAFSLRAAGLFREAAEVYRELLEVNSAHADGRLNAGVCFMKMGLYSQVKEVYGEAMDDYRVMFNLGIVHLAEGADSQAKSVLQRAKLITPDSDQERVINLLSEAEARAGTIDIPPKEAKKPQTAVTVKRLMLPIHTEPQDVGDSLSSPEIRSLVGTPKVYPRTMFKVAEDDLRPISSSCSLNPFRGFPHKKKTKRAFITAPPLPRPSLKHKFTNPGIVQTVETAGDGKEKTALQRVRVIAGFVEEDLEDERTLRQAEVDPLLVCSVKVKALEVSSVLRKEVNRLHSETDLLPKTDLDPILGWKLSNEVLAKARGELSKDPEERDLQQLVRLLSKLKFFSKFQADVRAKFLKIGIFQSFSQGHVIFSQGDEGGYMYVILQGSVTVKRTAPMFGSDPVIINTLHDGDSFGELTLFTSQIQGSAVGRSASCVAAEHTDLLMIEKNSYQEIMMHEIETQLETKINFLVSLPFLQGTPKFSLIPIASNMDPRTYRFNEEILRKGDIPNGLHIILSGHCSVYSEGFCIRPRRLNGYASARIRREAKESLQFGITQTVRFKKPRKRAEDEVPLRAVSLEMINATPGLKQKIQTFLHINDVESVLRHSFITQEKLLKTSLKEMDFFGGRALLDVTEAKPTAESLSKIAPSKYSVVAESSQVKIFVITRSLLPLLGEKLMDQIKGYLVKAEEPDYPQDVSDEDIIKEFNAWSAYKAGVIDEARRMQFLDKTENRGKSAQQLL